MKIYLAGVAPWKEEGIYDETVAQHHPYILESFYYANADTERLLPYFGDFLLDSGAFTFIQNSKTHVDWDAYIERYADFIKKNNVQKYFELDIDSIVGYEKVKEFRKRLERAVGWQSIPVWHKGRGLKEFSRMCDEYPYVAVGGIAIKEIRQDQYDAFYALIKEAHRKNAKIHGLGFTSIKNIKKYRFDSVDSTAWTTGNRFGYIYKFTGDNIIKIDPPKGKKLADSKAVALNNYTEWIKFQKYAEEYL